ncbi:MAG TPA: hypothetical protein VK606_04925 [Verrucomicrobiae bacterium]|jgi:hypothetical protein|nr:hypothetical protein [Verrucomicrobiae bacterium]
MKRVLVGFGVAVGMLLVGVVNASASTVCSIDPTYKVGTPINYSLDVSVLGTHVYASGTSKTTTFGGVIGI